MKIFRTFIYISLLAIGFILGISFGPAFVYCTPHSVTFQTPVPDDGSDAIEENLRCDIEDIEYLNRKIDENDLRWTHIDIMGKNVGFIIYEFRLWGSKQLEEKIQITESILKERKREKYSNQNIEPMLKTPVE